MGGREREMGDEDEEIQVMVVGRGGEEEMGGEERKGKGGDVFGNRLRGFRNSKVAHQKRLFAVISTMGDLIREQGLKPTATAYFAAIMASLESKEAEGDENVMAALSSFLAMVLPMIPDAVLRSKMNPVMAVVVNLVSSSATQDTGPGNLIAMSSLSCLSHLLAIEDKTQWERVSQPFDLLLQHCVDSRPKVRKKAKKCVSTLLTDFRDSPAHGAASEGVVSWGSRLFEAAMAAAGAVQKGAMAISTMVNDAINILDAFKQLLALLTSEAAIRSVNLLAQLCGLQQPAVTRHVANTLKTLSEDEGAANQVSATALGDLVLKVLELDEEGRVGRRRDPDVIISIIELVKCTFLRLHRLDPTVCAEKLPQAFNLVARNLASEQEEVVFATTECLKVLVQSCIDERMIAEGQAQMKIAPENRKGGLTSIEKLSLIIESLLGYQYATGWDMALLVAAAYLEKLGPAAYTLAANLVKTLEELQELSDANMPCRQQLHRAIGAAVSAMGPDQYLNLLPLDLGGHDLAVSRAWLLPILKNNIVGSRLRFFVDYLLPLSARLRERGRLCAAVGRPVAAKNFEACRFQVWNLLPSLCSYPTDTAESFRLLAKPLGDALSKEPELRECICNALQILIHQNKKARGDPDLNEAHGSQEKLLDAKPRSVAEERARALYTPEVAVKNLAAVGGFALHFLSILFDIFVSLKDGPRAFLQKTMDAIAWVADSATIKNFFISAKQKLLKGTEAKAEPSATGGDGTVKTSAPTGGDGTVKLSVPAERKCAFMDLALPLVRGLDEDDIGLLYTTARPGIQDSDLAVQKKSYKLLAKICEMREPFIASRATDMLEALLDSLGICHTSSRRGRLACLRFVIPHLIKMKDPKAYEAATTLIHEIILATTESNAKTRLMAFDMLASIGRGMEELDGDDGVNTLQRFIAMTLPCPAPAILIPSPSGPGFSRAESTRGWQRKSDLTIIKPDVSQNEQEVRKGVTRRRKVVVQLPKGVQEQLKEQRSARVLPSGTNSISDLKKPPKGDGATPDPNQGWVPDKKNIFVGKVDLSEQIWSRGRWLLGLLILQSTSSFVLQYYSELIQKHLVITLFLTMLVGAGGNAGNQSAIDVIRALATTELRPTASNVLICLKDQMTVGFWLATALMGLGFVRVLVSGYGIVNAVAISLSLFLIVLTSVAVGSMLPFYLDWMGIDPANAGTSVQVIMDVLGVTLTCAVCSYIFNLLSKHDAPTVAANAAVIVSEVVNNIVRVY